MTNEEMVLSIREGEKENGIEALWESVKKIVYSLAHKYYENGCRERADIDLEDLIQCGFFAMLDAIDAYDSESNYAFTTYLGYCCKNRFNDLTGYRSGKDNVKVKSLDAPVSSDTEDITLLESIADPSDRISATEEEIYFNQVHDDIESVLQSSPEADIVRREYWQGQTTEEIAQDLNCTPAAVRNRKQKCIRYLRRSQKLQKYSDMKTNYYVHVGVQSFQRSGFSSVEYLALREK